MDNVDQPRRHRFVDEEVGASDSPTPRTTGERFVAKILTLLAEAGEDAEAVLRKAELDCPLRSFLSHEIHTIELPLLVRVSAIAAAALSNVDAAQVGRPPFRGEDWQLLFCCLISSRSLREAATRACAFFRAMDGRLGDLDLRIADGNAEFRFSTHPNPISQIAFIAAVFGVINLHGLFSWLIGRRIPIVMATLRFSEKARGDIDPDFIPFPLTWNAEHTALRFPASYLDYPVVRTMEEWSSHPTMCFMVELDKDLSSDDIAETIRRVLSRSLRQSGGLPSLEEIATSLKLNRETLRRQLRKTGSSYNQIKDSCRRELGLELLLRTDLSVEVISDRLDFCDSDAFRRSMHEWVGTSPSAYRRRMKPVGLRAL